LRFIITKTINESRADELLCILNTEEKTNFFNVGGSFDLGAGVSITFFGEVWDLNMPNINLSST
jgi:hypothetical protein